MYRLFETIRVEDGVPMHIRWHEKRMQESRSEVWGIQEKIRLEDHIRVPFEFRSGIIRCRIDYGEKIGKIAFTRYEKRQIRSLKVVSVGSFDYHLKYADRGPLNSLYELRGECDDVLIIRNGLVTDSSFANLIFFDGKKWITPEEPLLKGTCRERLLSEKKVTTARISVEDLEFLQGCKLINAMRYPEEEETTVIKS